MTMYRCETPECNRQGIYKMPAGEMLCEEHGRTEYLGGCGSCLLGIVYGNAMDTEPFRACEACAVSGAGFGDVDGPADSLAVHHVAEIVSAMDDLRAALDESKGEDSEAVQECYRRLRVLTRTEAPDTSYGSEPREVARG